MKFRSAPLAKCRWKAAVKCESSRSEAVLIVRKLRVRTSRSANRLRSVQSHVRWVCGRSTGFFAYGLVAS